MNKQPRIYPHKNVAPLNSYWHKHRHTFLNSLLIEMINDFVFHTHKQLHKTNVIEFVNWSAQQANDPTPDDRSQNAK